MIVNNLKRLTILFTTRVVPRLKSSLSYMTAVGDFLFYLGGDASGEAEAG